MIEGPQQIPIGSRWGWHAMLPGGRIVTFHPEEEREIERGNLRDEHPARTEMMRWSDDHGLTWSEPRRAFTIPAGPGSASAQLPFVDRDGNLHVFGARYFAADEKNDDWDSIVIHTVSKDGGQTWSPLHKVDFGHDYTGALNSFIQLDSGRILVPLSYLDRGRKDGRFVAMAVWSDDGGQTWGQSNSLEVGGGGMYIESGAIEPVVIQLKGGMVWMLIRTTTGYFWESFSNDGAWWTPPKPTRIVASNAPGGFLRLRDGRLVLFWNNLYGPPFRNGISYKRNTLHAAVSTNEGQTWSRPKVVAKYRPPEPPESHVRYPYAIQAADGMILLRYNRVVIWPDASRNYYQEMVRIDPAWLTA